MNLEIDDDCELQFVSFKLICLDCDTEVIGMCEFGFDPDLKFECSVCGSRNTERE